MKKIELLNDILKKRDKTNHMNPYSHRSPMSVGFELNEEADINV
jgi:hypothetical protein